MSEHSPTSSNEYSPTHSSPSDTVIECIGLSRWYGEVQGLAGLDLRVGSGVIGLLGPNGSGKSTLMRLLTGLIKPSRGEVRLFGQRVTSNSHQLFQRVGHTPGDDIHLETERAVDFLSLLACLGGESRKDAIKRADHALDQVGLLAKREVKLNAMSKGMRQRVKVAQALLFEPQLLLLDEPLNGMDPISRRKTLDFVREFGESGKTVVLASHVLHEVEAVTEHLILLHHGRLLAEGKLSEIRALVDQKPRSLTISGDNLQPVAASLLAAELITGIQFTGEDKLQVETRRLNELLDHLTDFGRQGWIESMDLEDENLEAVFGMLVGDYA